MRLLPMIGMMLALFYPLSSLNASQDFNALKGLSVPKVLQADQAFVLSVKTHDDKLKLTWEINACCYLYQEHLQVKFYDSKEQPSDLLKQQQLPRATIVDDPNFGSQAIYKNQLQIERSLASLMKGQPLGYLRVEYQGCAESGFCYPPQVQWFEIKANGSTIQSVLPIEQAPALNTPDALAQESSFLNLQNKHFFTVLATFFLLGLLLTFTPCVLPMIPILCSVIVGQDHLNTRKAFWISLCYVLSMAFTYAGIGIVAALVGKNLQAVMQKPEIIIAFAALFTYLAFVQLGKVHFSPFRHIKQWLHNHHLKQESGSYVGAIVMGVLATLIASPCVTAPLIGALSYISQTGDIMLGGSALLALGLGIGTPLLIMGTLGGKYIPKTGAWMHAINEAFAILMFGLSIWLLSRVFTSSFIMLLWAALCVYAAYCLGFFKRKATSFARLGILFILYALVLVWGGLKGENDPLRPILSFSPWKNHSKEKAFEATFVAANSLRTLQTIQAQAKAQGSPLLLVFYADWCISCKHIEHELFNASNQIPELKGWMLAKADVTEYDQENQTLMKKFDLIGPPAILFFDSKGNELTKYRVVGETSREKFSKDLREACEEIKRN